MVSCRWYYILTVDYIVIGHFSKTHNGKIDNHFYRITYLEINAMGIGILLNYYKLPNVLRN